jgi:hypothetical protein
MRQTEWMSDGRSSDFSRDFFSTHFNINDLPENQARTEALWDAAKTAVVLHIAAKGGPCLWHGSADQGGESPFDRGGDSKAEPFSGARSSSVSAMGCRETLS